MSWEYRVLVSGTEECPQRTVYEVHYNDAGRIITRTEEPAEVGGMTIEEVIEDLSMMLLACSKPELQLQDVDACIDGTGDPVYADGFPIPGESDETLEEMLAPARDDEQCRPAREVFEELGLDPNAEIPEYPTLRWIYPNR